MLQFKTASQTPEEMKLATDKIIEAFQLVKGPGGEVSRAGMNELKKFEFELGELIFQQVNNVVATTDPTPFLVDVQEGDIRNQYVWQEVASSLQVVDRAYGTKPLSQSLTFSEFGIKTTSKEIVVEVPLEKIASGRYNPGLIAEVIAEAINRYRISFILDNLDTGVTSGADRTGKGGYTVRYTGLTEANLKNAVNGLMDEGVTPTIYGRHIALTPIQAFAGWATTGSDASLREFETRGMIGTFLGAPIVSLKDNFSRRTNSHVIRNDRVYLANGNNKAIYMRKDMSFLDFAEVLPAESVYRVGTRLEDGLLVYDKYGYRIITVS